MSDIIDEWDIAAKQYSDNENQSLYTSFCRNFIKERFTCVGGLKILDLGCGDGTVTHILAQNGATAIGCDGSKEMINIAKSKYSYQFDIVDILDSFPYHNNEFDMIICNCVLMDIEPIEKAITEANRVLKRDGLFFFSITHPSFYLGEWQKNEYGRITSKRITGYISSTVESQHFWGITTHYHRPLSYYFNRLAYSGFIFKEMFEPKVYEESKIPDIPLYLFAEFRKQ